MDTNFTAARDFANLFQFCQNYLQVLAMLRTQSTHQINETQTWAMLYMKCAQRCAALRCTPFVLSRHHPGVVQAGSALVAERDASRIISCRDKHVCFAHGGHVPMLFNMLWHAVHDDDDAATALREPATNGPLCYVFACRVCVGSKRVCKVCGALVRHHPPGAYEGAF